MLTASLTATQSEYGAELTIKDTTDYSGEPKSTFSSRVIKLQRSDGTLYPSGQVIPFQFADYPTDTIVIPGLDRDYAFEIVLELTSNAPVPGSTYRKGIYKALENYTMQFIFALNQEIAANPAIQRYANFSRNFMELVLCKSRAEFANSVGSVTSAQFALDSAKQLMDNKNLYF